MTLWRAFLLLVTAIVVHLLRRMLRPRKLEPLFPVGTKVRVAYGQRSADLTVSETSRAPARRAIDVWAERREAMGR